MKAVHTSFRTFLPPVLVTAVALGAIWLWFGFAAMLLAALLVILEITLSFDNAVVNAQVLKDMPALWRQRFLTWGILFAVVFTRAILPILIVAASAALSPWLIANIAFSDPVRYADLLEHAHIAINAFGGMFLVMVGLSYFIDEAKNRHWIRVVEQHLASWGRIEAVEIGIALFLLLALSLGIGAERAPFLFSGLVGVALFILVRGIASTFSVESANAAERAGLALFVYLNVLDAAFSLDSVVGAFALTTSLPIIIVGLGVGAYAVRFLTVLMVERETLGHFVYLEHGAHWAIIGLAAAMLADLFFHVPEPLTGLIGIAFVLLAYWSSVRLRRGQERT